MFSIDPVEEESAKWFPPPPADPCFIQINSLVAQQGSSTKSRTAEATCIRLQLESRSLLITAAFLRTHPPHTPLCIRPLSWTLLCAYCTLCASSAGLILQFCSVPLNKNQTKIKPKQGCGTAVFARLQAENLQLCALLIADNLLLVQQQLLGPLEGISWLMDTVRFWVSEFEVQGSHSRCEGKARRSPDEPFAYSPPQSQCLF